jgi:cell division protein FtsW
MRKYTNVIKGDKVIWIIYIVLTIISLIAVYSAIGRTAVEVRHTSPVSAWGKHVVFVILSYIIVILVSNLHYTIFAKISRIFYWASFGLLIYVLAFSSTRWINIPLLGSFQPSELAKVSLIAYLANMIAVNHDQLDELSFFGKVAAAIIIIAFPILLGNFSTAALIIVVCFIMLYFGGINNKYLLRTLLVVGIVAVVGLAMAVGSYKSGAKGDGIFARAATWGHRVDTFLNPDPNELTQENMARMAIASGGITGVGIGHTVHARLMTQADNDFIYAIIIEETGMVAGIVIFLLYSVLYFRCLKIARRCTGFVGSLMMVGYGTLIYLQALVNMAVAVGVMPVTGQTLPLISNGGTAYIAMAFAIGVIQSVSYETAKEEKDIKDKKRNDREFEEIKDLHSKLNEQTA